MPLHAHLFSGSKHAYHLRVLQSTTLQPVRVSGVTVTEEWRESFDRVQDLERVRAELARTLLDVQRACESSKDPEHSQRLISAAVRDLEELDMRLFEARTLLAALEVNALHSGHGQVA